MQNHSMSSIAVFSSFFACYFFTENTILHMFFGFIPLYQFVADPNAAFHLCKLKFDAAPFSGAVYFDQRSLQVFPNRIIYFAAVAYFRQADGAHDSVLMIERFSEKIIAACQLTAFQPADDPVYFEIRDHRFFRIQKNVARKPLMVLFQALALYPFSLDDFRGDTPNAVRILNDESDVFALLRLAKEAISMHCHFSPFARIKRSKLRHPGS